MTSLNQVFARRRRNGGGHERDRDRYIGERRGDRRGSGREAVSALGLCYAEVDQDFASCFAHSEDKRGAAWWFVPRQKGGTFSNLGNKSGAATYFVVINDRGTRREIALDQKGPDGGRTESLNACV